MEEVKMKVEQYQFWSEFVDLQDFRNLVVYEESPQTSNPAGANPHEDVRKLHSNRPNRSDAILAQKHPSTPEDKNLDEKNRQIKIRNAIDLNFQRQIHGRRPISRIITDPEVKLLRDVIVGHALENLSEDHARFLNLCLSGHANDKLGFMRASVYLELGTTIISMWYDKAVELFDSKDPKFIHTKDMLLKIQSYRRCTREQVQKEIIENFVRGGSTEQGVNAFGGCSNHSKESPSTPEPRDKSHDKSLNPLRAMSRPASEQENYEPAVPTTQDVQDVHPALVPHTSSAGSSDFMNSLNSDIHVVSQDCVIVDDCEGLGSAPSCPYSPNFKEPAIQENQNIQKTNQQLNGNNFVVSGALDGHLSASFSSHLEHMPDGESALASHVPFSNKPKTAVRKRQIPNGGVKTEPEITANKAKKQRKGLNHTVCIRVFTNDELIIPKTEAEDDYSYAWNSHKQNDANLRDRCLQVNEGIVVAAPNSPIHQGDGQNEMPDFGQQSHHLNNLETPQPLNNELDAGYQIVGQESIQLNNIEFPIPLNNGFDAGFHAFGQENHQLNNLCVLMPQNNDAGFHAFNQHCFPNALATQGYLPHPQLLPPQQIINFGIPYAPNPLFNADFQAYPSYQPMAFPQMLDGPGFMQPLALPVPIPAQALSNSPRGERKLPEAIERILPDSLKTDCNTWTEEDCRSWIENLGFVNDADLEYLRGQRFTKYDFLLLVESDKSRNAVFNMPRTVYTSILCNFNKVFNMHNGHH